jgi:hypothetical protein
MRTRASSLANSEAKGTWGSVRRFSCAFVIRNIMVEMGLGPDSMGLGLVSRRTRWE